MQPTATPAIPIVVEYDYGSNGMRRSKQFDNPLAAKKFYVAKYNAGKRPKVRSVCTQHTTSIPNTQTPPMDNATTT